MVIIEALLGCHDVLILGKSPIKWRQRRDMTIAVDWGAKPQTTKRKEINMMNRLDQPAGNGVV